MRICALNFLRGYPQPAAQLRGGVPRASLVWSSQPPNAADTEPRSREHDTVLVLYVRPATRRGYWLLNLVLYWNCFSLCHRRPPCVPPLETPRRLAVLLRRKGSLTWINLDQNKAEFFNSKRRKHKHFQVIRTSISNGPLHLHARHRAITNCDSWCCL
jgi:hypothetical protein